MELVHNLEVKYSSFYLSACLIILGQITLAYCQSVPRYSKDDQSGLVKVTIVGGWSGWICAQDYDERDAVVICRSLNLPHTDARPLKEAYDGPQDEKIVLESLGCHGNETSLEQCPGVKWKYVKCQSNQLVRVHCSSASEGKLRLMSGSFESLGRVEYFHAGSWTTVHRMNDTAAVVLCRSLGLPHEMARVVYGFHDAFRHERHPGWIKNVRCKGTERSWENCIVDYYKVPYQERFRDKYVSCEGLRLRGRKPHSGVLEGYFEDRWRSVYSTEFDSIAASVACKTLNFPRSAAEVVRKNNIVSGRNVMTFLDVGTCYGPESKLTDCFLSRWVFKESAEVTIACKQADMTDVKFRLTGGLSSSAGYLQVSRGGVWAYICRSGTDSAVATVACRTVEQPGFGGAVIPKNFIGTGASNIVMYELQCSGEETHLRQCHFNPWGVGLCPRMEALTIYCGSLENNFNTRLKDGGSDNFGRVEIYAYGTWYRVCKLRTFNQEDARVTCNQLQLPQANAEVTSCFDNGTSATWPTFVRCAGNEDSLKNCGTDIEVGSQQCNVLKVLCSDEKISNTDCFNSLPGWAIATLVFGILLVLLVAVCVFRKVRRNKEAHPVDNAGPQLYTVGENENFILNFPPPSLHAPSAANDAPPLANEAPPPATEAPPPANNAPPPAYDALPPAYDTSPPAYDTLFK